MGYAELIEQLQTLPEDKRAEVFDFVAFLAARFGESGDKPVALAEWRDADFSQMAMQQAQRGMENDPVTYTLDDLKERWQ
jgi:hypothetical protein